jgi:putative chitinase
MNNLQRFQKINGLTPDGIIGPNTLRKMMNVFRICDEAHIAHFIGQVAHETQHFKRKEENLNYSASRLREVFPKYFKTYEEAMRYARNPSMIANRVYANRMGNGPEESGDGWKFRGRGAIQTTGKNNYEILANKLKDLSILKSPDKVAEEYYFQSALIYFNTNNLWPLCNKVDNSSIIKLTKKINGGTNGLQDRISLTYRYYNCLATQ